MDTGRGSGRSEAVVQTRPDGGGWRVAIEKLRRDDPESAGTAERVLQAGEALRAETRALEAVVLVTDRRLLVVANARVALDIPYEGLRRVEFDLERDMTATLVIVPDHPRAEPQVLSIPAWEIANATAAVAAIGEMLARGTGRQSERAD